MPEESATNRQVRSFPTVSQFEFYYAGDQFFTMQYLNYD